MSGSGAAAFFRVEGVLVPRSAASCAAWMAANTADWLGRAGRVAATLAARPLARFGDAAGATKLAWRALEGCSEDRLITLGGWYADDEVLAQLDPTGLDLLARCRDRGDRIVLVSDHPRVALRGLVERLGADELIANRLEVVDGRSTGALVEPVVTGRLDGGWVRAYAARHGLDPLACAAYGHDTADATLLSGVGRPCAVTPTAPLRRLADDVGWPVVERR